MENDSNHGLNIKIIIGILVVIAGLVALLDSLGIEMGINIWDFWPLILIIIGLGKLARPREYRSTSAALIFIVIGLLFQLSTLDIIDFKFGHLWPIILILVGLAILTHSFRRSPKDLALASSYINFIAILGGGRWRYESRELKGGSAMAFMGGGDLILSGADIQGDSMVIDTFVMMGGIDIIVPSNWDVIIEGIPILGGIDNKTLTGRTDQPPKAKKLIIKGLVIMGGIEVKNA